jgi:hypothetical protein
LTAETAGDIAGMAAELPVLVPAVIKGYATICTHNGIECHPCHLPTMGFPIGRTAIHITKTARLLLWNLCDELSAMLAMNEFFGDYSVFFVIFAPRIFEGFADLHLTAAAKGLHSISRNANLIGDVRERNTLPPQEQDTTFLHIRHANGTSIRVKNVGRLYPHITAPVALLSTLSSQNPS